MAKLESNNLRRYALVGAEQRLAELSAESQQILRAFPELRARGGRSTGSRAAVRTAAESPRAGRGGRRRRRKISAEGRKRISEAQKARWAKVKGQRREAAPKPRRATKKR